MFVVPWICWYLTRAHLSGYCVFADAAVDGLVTTSLNISARSKEYSMVLMLAVILLSDIFMQVKKICPNSIYAF